MSQTASPTQNQTARTVASADHGTLDVRALVLLAVLLAAGFILNMTVSKALSGLTGGVLAPEFIIAAFCLEILVIRPKLGQAAVIGLVAGAVIQITASVKGVDLIAEPLAAVVMALIVSVTAKLTGTGAKAGVAVAGTFVTTVISGMIYACVVAFAVQSNPALVAVMFPVVLGTGAANAVIVGALYFPIKAALKLND